MLAVIRTVAELNEFMRPYHSAAVADVGLVMTMGALHQGHQSLIARARRENGLLVVSIFVNPLQFGAGEDLERYPRSLEADLELCRIEGVDAVFLPDPAELYPSGFGTTVVPPEALTATLCGLSRPGHFGGVATVVTKVINLVSSRRAYFGQKDAQQVAVIRRVVQDLNLDTEVVVCPTVRDSDGLALSSRNAYLSPLERTQARVLPRALGEAAALFEAGIRYTDKLIDTVNSILRTEPTVQIEYVAVVDPDSLQNLPEVHSTALVAIAARIGDTRLIDNILLGRSLVRLPIIAIDGPAGAGKSTLARRLAQNLGFLYIDTGAMYRAVTWQALQNGVSPSDGPGLEQIARRLVIRLAPGNDPAYPMRVWANGQEITRPVRDEQITARVSEVSAHPGVRTELVRQQRELGQQGGVVLDGRDVGTHVFPQAELKIYLTASVTERAERRTEDLAAKGLSIPARDVLEAQIRQRDAQDSNRAFAPLRKAADAVEVITDTFSIEQTLDVLLNIYERRFKDAAG